MNNNFLDQSGLHGRAREAVANMFASLDEYVGTLKGEGLTIEIHELGNSKAYGFLVDNTSIDVALIPPLSKSASVEIYADEVGITMQGVARHAEITKRLHDIVAGYDSEPAVDGEGKIGYLVAFKSGKQVRDFFDQIAYTMVSIYPPADLSLAKSRYKARSHENLVGNAKNGALELEKHVHDHLKSLHGSKVSIGDLDEISVVDDGNMRYIFALPQNIKKHPLEVTLVRYLESDYEPRPREDLEGTQAYHHKFNRLANLPGFNLVNYSKMDGSMLTTRFEVMAPNRERITQTIDKVLRPL